MTELFYNKIDPNTIMRQGEGDAIPLRFSY